MAKFIAKHHLMKPILITLFCLYLAPQLFARCSGRGIEVFPKTETIKQNAFIVIEGYALSQKIIQLLGKTQSAYLEAKNHRVRLEVKSVFVGAFELTQAVLIPAESLISGSTYYLTISGLSEDEQSLLEDWNADTKKTQRYGWRVEKGSDKTSPEWRSLPKWTSSSTVRYGCGPARYGLFDLSVHDETEVLVKTELMDLTSNSSTVYFLPLDGSNQLRIGHGMCSGAFSFKENHTYHVRFSLMDSCGNVEESWTEWIEFENPYDSEKS